MRDRDWDNDIDCVQVDFMPFNTKDGDDGKVFESSFIERFQVVDDESKTRVTKKYDLEISVKGIGWLDYFWDAWLWGRSSYNIIMLDYSDTILSYGCDHYFWIYHYEYFWVYNRKPEVSFDKQMYYINYVKSKFPNYANDVPVFFQGDKCFSAEKLLVKEAVA